MTSRALSALAALLVAASCASGPSAPDWQSNARDAIDAAVAAYLRGDTRVQDLEFQRARSEVARTGRPDLVARVELMRCAARVASLVFEPCEGFDRLLADAHVDERAYADHLAGRTLLREDIERLPSAQRGVAAVVAGGVAADDAVRRIDDPLSRLVAAGVLFQAGKASPGLIALAADTASAQGWRRPLLAWLNVQASLAQRAGNTQEAHRLQRRIELVR